MGGAGTDPVTIDDGDPAADRPARIAITCRDSSTGYLLMCVAALDGLCGWGLVRVLTMMSPSDPWTWVAVVLLLVMMVPITYAVLAMHFDRVWITVGNRGLTWRTGPISLARSRSVPLATVGRIVVEERITRYGLFYAAVATTSTGRLTLLETRGRALPDRVAVAVRAALTRSGR